MPSCPVRPAAGTPGKPSKSRTPSDRGGLMRRTTFLRLAAAGAASLAAAAMSPGWASGGAHFGAPIRVTPANGGGYEPGIYADADGDLFMTAHKENAELALSPDSRSATGTRSMSWAWMSTDGGRHWTNLPLGPADARNHEFGDEGDMAMDDANNLYFVDTEVADVTFTSWHIAGQGKVSFKYNTPILGSAQGLDDRPWITAHLNGHVFYFGNQGDKDYPLGQGHPGNGNGPGRYTVYSSYDGGQTFDTLGYTLKSSGWCRPLAERGTKYVYAICTNDGVNDNQQSSNVGKLFAFVSSDDGHTFSRYTMGTYHANDGTQSWPTVAIGANHTVWALYVDAAKVKQDGTPIENRLILYKSTDHGKTWTHRDITPVAGRYEYGWLSVGPSGNRLGLGIYYRPDNHSDWHVYGAIFGTGSNPTLTSLAPN